MVGLGLLSRLHPGLLLAQLGQLSLLQLLNPFEPFLFLVQPCRRRRRFGGFGHGNRRRQQRQFGYSGHQGFGQHVKLLLQSAQFDVPGRIGGFSAQLLDLQAQGLDSVGQGLQILVDDSQTGWSYFGRFVLQVQRIQSEQGFRSRCFQGCTQQAQNGDQGAQQQRQPGTGMEAMTDRIAEDALDSLAQRSPPQRRRSQTQPGQLLLADPEKGLSQAVRFDADLGGQAIAVVLPLGFPGPGQPQQAGVEKEQGPDHAQQQIEQIIVTLDVGQLMGEQGLDLIGRNRTQQGDREQDDRAQVTENDRRADAPAAQQLHRTAQGETALQIVQTVVKKRGQSAVTVTAQTVELMNAATQTDRGHDHPQQPQPDDDRHLSAQQAVKGIDCRIRCRRRRCSKIGGQSFHAAGILAGRSPGRQGIQLPAESGHGQTDCQQDGSVAQGGLDSGRKGLKQAEGGRQQAGLPQRMDQGPTQNLGGGQWQK